MASNLPPKDGKVQKRWCPTKNHGTTHQLLGIGFMEQFRKAGPKVGGILQRRSGKTQRSRLRLGRAPGNFGAAMVVDPNNQGWISTHHFFHSWWVGILVNPPGCINTIHVTFFNNIGTTVGSRKAFQKRRFGKWLELWKSYGFVSSDRTTAAWTSSFSEKRAAVSQCRDETCLWDVDNLRWSWRSPESDLSMSFPWGVSLPCGHVRFMLPQIGLDSDFHSALHPISWHSHFESSTICKRYPSYPQKDCFPLWFLPV